MSGPVLGTLHAGEMWELTSSLTTMGMKYSSMKSDLSSRLKNNKGIGLSKPV